jgi:hypothetical protein
VSKSDLSLNKYSNYKFPIFSQDRKAIPTTKQFTQKPGNINDIESTSNDIEYLEMDEVIEEADEDGPPPSKRKLITSSSSIVVATHSSVEDD